jgi:nucleotide-binding universal stress UspA family protein
MIHVKHILVPVDFEEPSLAALETATDLALQLGAELTVMHAWELPYTAYTYAAGVYSTTDLWQPFLTAAEEQLKKAMKRVHERMPAARSSLRNGPVAIEIQKAIRETGADLVVVGTHGRKGLDHLMLGSVAEKTVRSSPVPVLVAK